MRQVRRHDLRLRCDPALEAASPRGTPIAQYIPLPRLTPDLDFATMDPRAAEDVTRIGEEIPSTPGVCGTKFHARSR